MKDRYILGISAFYHDSAACLLRNGDIVAAGQEERFTRKKGDARFPHNAVDFCLREAGIKVQDLDFVGFYDKPLLKFERILETYLGVVPRGFRSFLMAGPLWIKDKLYIDRQIKEELGYAGEVLYSEHHESHAASAFFPSPFKDAAILTIDGVGEWATASIGLGRGSDIEIVEELHWPDSLGLLYSAFTYYTGFKVNSGEYKVMGLAPYGEPKYVDLIYKELIDLREDGSFRLNQKYFNYLTGLTMTNGEFDKLIGGPPREPESKLTQRAPGVARCRLNPDALERPLAQEPPVADAIERDAARQAQVLGARLAVRGARHPQHDLLADFLNGSRQIHLALCQLALGLARRPANQLVELAVGHRQAREVVEVLLIEPERSVVAQIDQFLVDDVDVFRLAVRRESHDLVFAGVDLEPGVVRERRIQQSKRIRPVQLVENLEIIAAAAADRSGRPFADTVDCQDRRLLERRRQERAGGVGLVMLAVQDISRVAELLFQLAIDVQLVFDPQRPGHQERREPSGRDAEVRFQNSLELQQRFVVETDRSHVVDPNAGVRETELDCPVRKAGVAFLPGEALFLSGGDDLAAAQQARGAVVVEGRDSEDVLVAHMPGHGPPLLREDEPIENQHVQP